MTKIIYTIWALVLNSMGISIFKTCFVDALEDEYGDNFLSGPPITSFIFALGVYTIITNLNIYPAYFRNPITILMSLYEFLVTSFLLDFCIACIWTPIDFHIYITLTKTLRRILLCFGMNEAAAWILYNKFPMAILCFIISIGFFLITLHITRSVDFSMYTDYGICCFIGYLKNKLIKRIACELPRLCEVQCSGCKSQKRTRGRKRSRRNINNRYEND
ncbi:PREDICTED: uncharacterized protein LOC105359910 [Ceratosolen solmsi marchali]|uniref:Uncharacterized protein LOC105359910 n=1 Tax=Ceratosolen solmsi marchali TaxID=326594 RepID=A0AAJ6VLV7_9HYME|nr:PREDICTED: uncharacterized protein LOC105359910 [Ceratosolen solmsi marchali]